MNSTPNPINLNLEQLLQYYLDSKPYTSKTSELEVRFSGEREVQQGRYRKYTIGQKYTKVDYDNVIQKLLSFKFKTENPQGSDLMRIYIENLRAEIDGINAIQHYCINENMDKLINDFPHSVEFQKKKPATIIREGTEPITIQPVENPDYNLKYVYSTEQIFSTTSEQVRTILSQWDNKKKFFRYINRVTLTHPDYPIKVDISIIKTSNPKNKSYTLNESQLFKKHEKYEIELEVDNSKINTSTTVEELSMKIKKVIKYVLMGLQLTNYPVSFTQLSHVSKNYLEMIFGKEIAQKQNMVYSNQFIGPSSITLQVENIVPLTEENNRIPNIRNKYIVTDKADGQRTLLFINDTGYIFLINTNLNFIFTGRNILTKKYCNTLLDGEYITKDKLSKSINLFAGFDIYYLNGEDVRHLPFKAERECRLDLLTNIVDVMNKDVNYIFVTGQIKNPFTITCKEFYDYDIQLDPSSIPEEEKIFTACIYLLDKVIPTKRYTTDGLIFTPKEFGVGGSPTLKMGKKQKITWDYSFKWKPPEFNTIDFLVVTKKNGQSTDLVTSIFQEGLNTTHCINQLPQYKTLGLYVGYDKIHSSGGYGDPCSIIYKGEFNDVVKEKDDGNYSDYKPILFNPIHPSDENAGICNIMLNLNGEMVTEENEVFADNMIVEFRYDNTQKNKWKWKPLRVRYDKTARYKKGEREYGNSFHVANSNWRSIQNKIDEDMIKGRSIPILEENQDIYYNRITTSTYTRALRDFHNLFVKKILIKSVSQKGNILIDYACGKAGDLSKWIEAELRFVFGMDISKDNIENRLDGACSRFLSSKYTNKKIPDALFVQADSSKNIKDGKAFHSDTGKLYSEIGILVSKSIFQDCSEEQAEKIGKYVKDHYGIGKHGFNISSCQFALHYFFKNVSTCNNFIKNVSQCTKINGYFIGTCYDGRILFRLLQGREKITYYSNDGKQKILEIIKKYSQTEMENNKSCLGYTISVFQESINKSFDEYLVNFDYFDRLMNIYGFQLVDSKKLRQIELPDASGSFELLFNKMRNILSKDPMNKAYGESMNMTPNEKNISFLNRYFIYEKIRNVDYRHIPFEEEKEKIEEEKEEKEIIEEKMEMKEISKSKIIKKFKEKLILENAEIEKEVIVEKEVVVEEQEKVIKKPRKTKAKLLDENIVIVEDEPEKEEKELVVIEQPVIEELVKEPVIEKVKKTRKTKTKLEGEVVIKKPRKTKAKLDENIVIVEEEPVIVEKEVVVEEPVKEKEVVVEKVKKPRKTKSKLDENIVVVEEPEKVVVVEEEKVKKPRKTKAKLEEGEPVEKVKKTRKTKAKLIEEPKGGKKTRKNKKKKE
jgi:hypothetical protein